MISALATLEPATRPVRAEAGRADAAGFAEALGDAARATVLRLREAEAVAVDGIAGRASVQEVVSSVMAAERSLTTALAVRDKLVSAWLEIQRMPV